MKYLFSLLLVISLLGCSSTQYESASLLDDVSPEKLKQVSLFIDTQGAILASQADVRLFKLHHNQAQVQEMFENIARRMGFQLSSEQEAEYRLKVKDVKPDGGQCVKGLSSFNKGMSFTLSVMTLGVLPATNGYCIEVNSELFYRQRVYGQLSEDLTSLAEFRSIKGKISVLAGANEVDNYQRIVTLDDEARAMEVSIVHLFKDMIFQGAFD